MRWAFLFKHTLVLPILMTTVFAVSQPYALLGLLVSPLQVVLYWDAPDNDEDTFITKSHPDSPHSVFIKEESKRDADQRFKLKLKPIHFTVVSPFIGSYADEAFTLIWSLLPITPYPEIPAFTFHPPNFSTLHRVQ